MMRAGWVALIFAGALHGAAVAGAIELQLVDQESDRQTSPAQAPDSGCTTDADGAFIPHLDNDSASLQVRTNTLATGSQCEANVQSTSSGAFTLTVIGAPGASGSFCYVTSFEASTAAQGGTATATQNIGGSPYTTAGGVFLNGNPISSVLRHFDANQADGATVRGQFTATVGDMIRIAAGSNSQGTLEGAGLSQSQGKMFAAIYVGDCPRDRAPVASPIGLIGLAAALASLGALGLGWKGRRTKAQG